MNSTTAAGETTIQLNITAALEQKLGWCDQKAIKLRGNTKNKIAKDENGENVPHLGITEVVLVHCNIVNNDYQHDSRVFYTFIHNKSFGHLLDILSKKFITFNSELKYGLLIKILNH